MFSNTTALGRVDFPHDIGSVVPFLFSNDAKWIDTERIEVLAGFHI